MTDKALSTVIWKVRYALIAATPLVSVALFWVSSATPALAEETAAKIVFNIGSPKNTKKIVRLAGQGEPFQDCPEGMPCPDMVVIPATGADDVFMIGSPETEKGHISSERQHKRTLKPFAIGKFEVRVAEYMACVKVGGCRHPEWAAPNGQHNVFTGKGVTYRSIKSFIIGDDQPVVGISWQDATDYAAWLSKITGQPYRLPSESEWEYATRAGAKTAYWWGDDIQINGKAMACCEGCGSERDAKGLFAVKSFSPNPWGLHNVHGNVWEWVADYYCESYAAASDDGSAKREKSCPTQRSPEGLRIFRGGSCFYEPRQMRAAMRLRNWPSFRNMTVGFRVARSILAGSFDDN